MTDPTKPAAGSAGPDFAGMRTLPLEADGGGTTQRPLQPGEMFAGRYRIDSLIGEGGSGSVYQALDTTIDQPVALKVVRAGRAQTAEARKQLVRETILARNIRHPNVVAVHDAGLAGEQAYMVMELLQGANLRSWLRTHNSQDSDCAYPLARAIMLAILDGLDEAHAQGVVHRDLKPENVFLLAEPNESGARLKLLDFGLAQTDGPQASGASMLGTPHYMAPEQITAPDTTRPSADIYSLSVMFYELLVGVLPQGHWQPPGKGRDDVPAAVDALIEAGLSNRARLRPQSAAEFRTALLAASMPAAAPPAPPLSTQAAHPAAHPAANQAANPAATQAAKPVSPVPPPAPAPAAEARLDVAATLKRAQALFDKAYAMTRAQTPGWNEPLNAAHALFKQAAATDAVPAKIAYGSFLYNGLSGYWPAQPEAARSWFESAAKDGSGEAMNWLGEMDRFGKGGPKNPAASIAWYIKAGEAGYAQGDYAAGFAYRGKLRDWGEIKDPVKARYYFERAAHKGQTSAMMHLGAMCAEGEGGPKDRTAARDWFEMAEKAGHHSAADSLKDYKLR